MHTLRIATISILSLLIGVSALVGGFYVASAFTGPTIAPPGGDGAIRSDSSGNIGINVAPSASYKLYVGGNLGLTSGSKLDFFDNVGDKVLWYSNVYGTGIEDFTLTDWSTQRFRWRIGGTSVSTGVAEMILTATGLRVNNSTDPAYPLDVTGDINFTGQLRQNGTPVSFGGSQWITTGSNIYYNTGSVGIGNTSPSDPLHVTYNNSAANVPGISVDSSGSQSVIGLRLGGTLRGAIRSDAAGNLVLDSTGTGSIYFGVPDGTWGGRIFNGGKWSIGSVSAPAATTYVYVASSTSIGQTTSYGSMLQVGNAAADFPGNAGWAASSWNSNIVLTGATSTSITFHDSGCCLGSIRHTSQQFHIGENVGWNTQRVFLYDGLILGSKTTAAAPAAVNGTIFYDTTLNKFRCYENGSWKDCIGSATYQ